MKKLFLRAEFGPLWEPWEVDEIGRKNMYTAQTLPPDYWMLVLRLDTLLFGEMVCVHYKLNRQFF